jgi:hypothetical protein
VRGLYPSVIRLDDVLGRWHRRQRKKKDVTKKAAMTSQPLMTTKEYRQTPESLVPTELIYGVMRAAERHSPITSVPSGT